MESEQKTLVVTKENYASLDRTKLTNAQKGKQTFFKKEAEREAEAIRKESLGLTNCKNCRKEYGKNDQEANSFYCSFKCYIFSYFSSSGCASLVDSDGSIMHPEKKWVWFDLQNRCFLSRVPTQKWIFWTDKKQGSKEYSYTGRQASYALFHTSKNKELNFEEEYEDNLECPKNKECINPYHFKEKYEPSLYERLIQSKLSDKDLEKFEQTHRSRLYWAISVGFIEGESEEKINYYLELLSDLNGEKKKAFSASTKIRNCF